MQVSVIVFQIGYDRFSAVAVDIGTQVPYQRVYGSISEVIDCLESVGLVSPTDIDELESGKCFEGGCPIFKGPVDDEALEDAGFLATKSKPN